MILHTIPAHQAARAFEACAGLDPEGQASPASAAQAGTCFEIETETGSLVLSVGPREGALWCYGAAGQGQGMTYAGLDWLERLARASGCGAVAFQTMRRGLVKRARSRGYLVARQVGRGYVLQKVIA